MLYGSKCFMEVGFTDTSLGKLFQDAEAHCNEVGGYLASVPNAYYGCKHIIPNIYNIQ